MGFGTWFSRTLGATVDNEPPPLVVVHEGAPGECEIVALRLKSEGLQVHPDPSPRFSSLNGISNYRAVSRRDSAYPSTVVAVPRSEEARARAVIDAIEAI